MLDPVICPDCDSELEQDQAWSETRLRPAERWRCTECQTRWHYDAGGLLTEA
jgi:transposase-like protein